MKIAIDCRSLRKSPAGVPNFLLSVINTLALQKKEWTLYLLSNEDFHEEATQRLVAFPNVIKVIEPLSPVNSIAILWYILKVPFIVRRLQPDIFYTPIPNLPFFLPRKTKTLVTLHDMVYKYFPKTMSLMNWSINFFLHDRSIKNADYIWAISNYTKGESDTLFPKRHCKSIFVGSAVDKKIFHLQNLPTTERQELLLRFDIQEKFVLFVGTLEPRKNLNYLISLMPHLRSEGFSLLIVGARGWGKTELGNLISAENQIRFSEYISTKELVKLYSIANVYVSTALNEGFGLPQLEAMCCGCPVVSPHNSAMIEIVEGAGETVKGWDKKEWVETILKVSGNRQYYISRGFQRAEAYDWNRVIEGLVHYLAAT